MTVADGHRARRRPMIRLRSPRTLGAALALLLVGGSLVAGAAVAAGAPAGPTITATPHSRLTAGRQVVVKGRGFTHQVDDGVVLECNPTPDEPYIDITIGNVVRYIPVGCTDPVATTTSHRGRLAATKLTVASGTLGAWETGNDSADSPAAADSVAYPCPPTAAQEAQGVSCVVDVMVYPLQQVTLPVAFGSSGPTTTTVPPTTTTTEPCAALPASATASPPDCTATVTVTPGACLVNGTVATVAASGLIPRSGTNHLGEIFECNSDPDQPTQTLLGLPIGVSCTGALEYDFDPPSSGSLTASFTVVEGITGPPLSGVDSAGNDAAVDAANYPCPPTAGQQAAGDTCDLRLIDLGGDAVDVPLRFHPDGTSSPAMASP
jgi:hypothetical protein